MSTINHIFETISIKTARKDGTKYLGKDGSQAYRVSIKIGDDWYANMIWQEELLPKKGRSYNIELKEEGEWKNWDYKMLTKKEQMEQVQNPEPTQIQQAQEVFTPAQPNQPVAPMPTEEYVSEKPPVNLHGRGASWNNAVAIWCSQKELHPAQSNREVMMAEIEELAKFIAPYQEKFVKND